MFDVWMQLASITVRKGTIQIAHLSSPSTVPCIQRQMSNLETQIAEAISDTPPLCHSLSYTFFANSSLPSRALFSPLSAGARLKSKD